MSRAEDNLIRKFEARDRNRLASAAEKITHDPDLRFFFAAALNGLGAIDNSGMAVNPHSGNALTTAHETGKIAALQYIVNSIAEHRPDFYPAILTELINERTSRTADLAAAAAQADRDSR